MTVDWCRGAGHLTPASVGFDPQLNSTRPPRHGSRSLRPPYALRRLPSEVQDKEKDRKNKLNRKGQKDKEIHPLHCVQSKSSSHHNLAVFVLVIGFQTLLSIKRENAGNDLSEKRWIRNFDSPSKSQGSFSLICSPAASQMTYSLISGRRLKERIIIIQ